MNTINVVISKYSPMFVKDICILDNKSPLMLNKSLIINWSKGLWDHMGADFNIIMNWKCISIT